jgi:predicted nucleic acid-binding protein
MRSIVFDTSTIISLVTNNLLWITEKLKHYYNGDFILPKSVETELINYPLTTKKYKLEALIIKDYVEEGIFKLYSSITVKETANNLLNLANHAFISKNHPIKILSLAEIEALSIAIRLKSDALAVDERTLRLLIENPDKLHKLLEHKLNKKIIINKEALKEIREKAKDVKIIRSTELATVAYDAGLLDKYISTKKHFHKELKKTLLEGVLWGLKLRGASISTQEINEIIKARFLK